MRYFSVSVALSLVVSVFLFSGCGGESGDVLLNRGMEKLKSGDAKAAIVLLDKAAVSLPKDPGAAYHLGVAYFRAGNKDKAMISFRSAAELAPADPAPLEFMAQVAMSDKKWKDAGDFLNRADQLAPVTPRIVNAMGVVEMNGGDSRKAFNYLMAAREKDPSYAPAVYNLGVLYRDQAKNNEQAAKFFRQYLQLDPNGPHAATVRSFLQPRPDKKASPADSMLKKAREAMKSEDYAVAIESYRAAVDRDAANPDVTWELALAYEKVANLPKAVECYAGFRKQFPNDQRAAQAAKKVDELGGSKAVEKSVVTDPAAVTKPKEAFAEAFRRQSAGDLDGSIAFYKRACQLDPSYAEAFFNLGLACKQNGKLEPARAAFKSAADLKPAQAQFRYMLALAHRDLKDNEKAIKELNNVLRTKPDYADAYLVLGLIYKEEHRADMSKKYFDLYQEYQKH